MAGVYLDVVIRTRYGNSKLWKKIMKSSQKTSFKDMVLPFQLDLSDIRGRMARLDNVLDEVLSQHNYPPMIEALVAEMVLLTTLIGQTMKLRWKLSLQVRGDGPVRLIATDYYGPDVDDQPARVRAYASFNAEKIEPSLDGFSQIGKGYFAILIDQGRDTKPYQGITPIAGGSLSTCAETYFAQSEQLPSRFLLAFGHSQERDGTNGWRAGGIMLQHMPTAGENVDIDKIESIDGKLQSGDLLGEEENENWNRVNLLLDTAEQLELVGPSLSPTRLIQLLFHEEKPRVFDAQKIIFGCTCSRARVKQSLSIYSAKDIGYMITEDNQVTADCQFCGSHYSFDPDTLGFESGSLDDHNFKE